MSASRRARRPERPRGGGDPAGAIEALSGEELRCFLRDVLKGLDEELRASLEDELIARAAKGSVGWKPSGPTARAVAEVASFAQAARSVGFADPAEVDARLRQGTMAFLAGDHAAARAVFEALLLPVADGEMDLGQHEMVDEVLTVDVHECAAQYVASVYATTPIAARAEAVWGALDAVQGVAALWGPLEAMERAATGPLPELDAFLPRWVAHLERQPLVEGEWDSARDRWLREAVLRLEGVAGLERIARGTRRPETLRAWCQTLAASGEWAEALRAYDEAVSLAGGSDWQGHFLDGAALAARELGRPDAAERLEAAWLGAPSLVRLLRWLDARGPEGAALASRATEAKARCPPQAGRQLGLLHLLTGDVREAADLLAQAPGLGWSDEDHPGHVLFPAFASLLARSTGATLPAELLAGLQQTPRDPWDLDLDELEDEAPGLVTPPIATILERSPSDGVDAAGREAMLEAMRLAAERRVEGVLGDKRRRHYGHAALLVACCLELAPGVGRHAAVAEWVAALRKRYARFPAFQEECDRALGSTGS